MLALAAFYEQAELVPERKGLAAFVAAGRALAEAGLTVAQAAPNMPLDAEPAPPKAKLAWLSKNLARPPRTTAAESALAAAIRTATGRPVETHGAHLLIAALDPNAAATQLLDRMGIDVGGLRQRMAGLAL